MEARASVHIGRSPEAVFDFISDPANDHAWRSHLISSRGRITGTGDRVTHTYSYQGRTATIDLEVTEHRRPERLTLTIRDPAKIRITLGCRAEDGGTRVSATIRGELPLAARVFAGRIQKEADELVRADLASLKRALETSLLLSCR